MNPVTSCDHSAIVARIGWVFQSLPNGLGFTTTGLIGTWTLTGTNDTINVVIGAPPAPSAVPGPLPLLGAGAAFGFSRRLRRRVSLSRSIPHSATSISA